MSTTSDAVSQATAWKQRNVALQSRALAAHQRDRAAAQRAEAGLVREEAGRIRADAARVRDDAARTRDEAARVRDRASQVRDEAARSRDQATQVREEALRLRLARSASLDASSWAELLALDRTASEQSRDAANRDREAAELDRDAAEKDRTAAERDRSAANSDRLAADKDREAADREREAADSDREAADADRAESERDLGVAEVRLSKAERLAAMGHLSAAIAHEVNSPVASILTTLGAMSQALAGGAGAPELLAPMIENARYSAERIASVVADMKAWLHDDAGSPARQEVDVARLVKGAVRLTRFELDPVARLVVDVQPTPALWGVAARLERVLTNLLLNAAQAITGPRESNEIRITARASGPTVVLEVHDTGVGIPPEALPHIFDPFFTTREGRGGTGLGLAMCRRIVAEHSGTLTVESRQGEGSTFRVELPSGSATEIRSSDAAAPQARPGVRRARVLVIDDNPPFARSMVMLLSGTCDVAVAGDGQEGLDQLLAPGARFDVVLCDLTMPVMGGVEFYRRLRELRPQDAPNVVFVTGGATTPEAATFLANTPNVQLQKPFPPERLLALIAERMAHASPQGPPATPGP